MKWITRQNANVDRIACPWLIKRFIDADAEFLYVGKDEVLEVAARDGAHSYDAPGAEIVHAADLAADRDSSPEGAGLYAIAHGFALLHGTNDHAKLDLENPMYDALYAWCQEQVSA